MIKKLFLSKFGWTVFLCMILVTVTAAAITGYAAYLVAKKMLLDNTYSMMQDTVYQMKIYIDDKFILAKENFLRIENNPSYMRIMKKEYKGLTSQYYLDVLSVFGDMQKVCDDYNAMIDSIYFYEKNGTELYVIRDYVVQSINGGDELLERLDDRVKGEFIWQNIHTDSIFEVKKQRNVITIMKCVGKRDSLINAVMIMNLKLDVFMEAYNHAELFNGGYFMLLSEEEILYSNSYSQQYELHSDGILQIRESGTGKEWLKLNSISNDTMMVTCINLESNGWTLAVAIPEREIISNTDIIKINTMVVVAIAVIIGLAISFRLGRSLSNSVETLTGKVREMGKGNLNVDFTINSDSEIGELADGLNQLVQRVNELLIEVKEKERLRRKSDLAVMQEQINPHFLYNTLASAKGLVNMQENEKADYMLERLISFFRTGLNNGKSIVTLKEEINHVSSYLDVQRMRYGDLFTYEIEIDNDLMDVNIIRLLLQPIVENALYHGIKESGRVGVILISAHKDADDILISIFDDGKGISEAKLEKLRTLIYTGFNSKDSDMTYGLRNVQQRIMLHYGDEYKLEIKSVEDEYTQIVLRIPYEKRLEGSLEADEIDDCR